jgi:hypothetical protein
MISHPTPTSLNGPKYGRPIAVYVRPRKGHNAPSRPSRSTAVAGSRR